MLIPISVNRLSRTGPHFRRPLPQVEREIRRGRAQHRLRPVDGPVFRVGTSPDCDKVLGGLQFPATHLYLLVTRDGVLLRHLGAPPEVTVNGGHVESTVLRHGDRIRTGPLELAIAIHSGRRPNRPEMSPRTTSHQEAQGLWSQGLWIEEKES